MAATRTGFTCCHCSKPIYVGEATRRMGGIRWHVRCPSDEAETTPAAAPARSPEAPRQMTARYDSRCVRCGCRIAAGTTILYSRATGAAHVSCPASSEPRVVAYRERRDRTEGGLFEADYE